MSKSIAVVGFPLATEKATRIDFREKASLLDWDVILFRPDISDFLDRYGEKSYKGKRCLDDTASFELKECAEHWRREIREAIEGGKSVIVFLSAIEEVYVATGTHAYSGTGRNRQVTRHVDVYSNYHCLPISEKITATSGSAMKLSPDRAKLLSGYWNEFGKESTYRAIFPETKRACILTRSGDKAVALLITQPKSGGNLLLLPDLDFNRNEFTDDDGEDFTDEAHEFAGRLIATAVQLDKTLRAESDATPEPLWLSSEQFATKKEKELRQELLAAEGEVKRAQLAKEAIEDQLLISAAAKSLLFETGQKLELAIIEALLRLGFSAARFQNAESEFDVVFSSDEGRLIGEAEGKDNKAINVEKLRQLSMNIHEDLQREEVDRPAKGILFGNAFRNTPPEKRGAQFTEKCISAAQMQGIGLVATSDLFHAVKHVADTGDLSFSKACRESLVAGIGIVTLPNPPDTQPEVSEIADRAETSFDPAKSPISG